VTNARPTGYHGILKDQRGHLLGGDAEP